MLWPVLDRRQASKFKALCFSTLHALERRGSAAAASIVHHKLPRGAVQRSHINAAGGPAFQV